MNSNENRGTKPEPSAGPLKLEPTPERAREEKQKREAEVAAEEAPKRSGAV